MAILDQFGRPIPTREVLTTDQAGPTLTGVRQVLGGHPAAGLTPAKLARLLREAEDGDPIRYLELAEDLEERDLHYAGVLATRKRAVAQLEIAVTAAGDDAEWVRQADLVRAWLKRDELQDELIDLLDAVGKGFSVTEIVWAYAGGRWWPERLEWRDPRFFQFDPADGRTVLLRDAGGPRPLDAFKYIVHQAKTKSGLPIRGGLARIAAWPIMFKTFGIKDWIVFCEVYGHPLRLGKYDAGSTEEDKRVLLNAVANIASDAAAIIPKSMEIAFESGGGDKGSADLYERLCDWLDRQISKAVLGQTLTTEVKGGSLAAAQVHDGVRADLMRADARQLAATLNRDVVRPLITLNFGPQDKYPRLEIGLPDELGTAETLTLVPLGLRVQASEVRDLLGFVEPEEGAEVLGVPTPPPAEAARLARQQRQAAGAGDRDAIDLTVDALLADGPPPPPSLIDAILTAAREAQSFEDFAARLRALAAGNGSADWADLIDALDRATFAARVAGRIGEPLA